MVQDIARAHLGHLVAGMGFSELASQLLAEQVAGVSRVQEGGSLELDGEAANTYLGVPVGPFGVLPLSVAQARAQAASLAQTMPGAFRFVGIDAEVLRSVLADHRVEPRGRRSAGPIQIGPDGFLFAPIERITPRSVAI